MKTYLILAVVAAFCPGLTETPSTPLNTRFALLCEGFDRDNLLDAFDLVITPFTDQIEPEVGRSRVTYRERCLADVEDIADTQSLFLTTTDCGGDPQVCCCDIEWILTDPDFNPEQRAFYYARVLEIPTPRWSTIEAFRFGITLPSEVPMMTQERAYTSPIWYTP